MKEPAAHEGAETQKRLAKAAFGQLPVPAKNLLLGLTDLETKMSKCQILARQKLANEAFDVFQTCVDRMLSQARQTQEKNLDVFRECEERFLMEWTACTTDEEVASLAFAVTKVLKTLDLFVEDVFAKDANTLDLQAELRNPEDLEDDLPNADESKNLHRLQKKSTNLLTHAKEVSEFVKRRIIAKDSLQHDAEDYLNQQKNARAAAQARFGLHELWDHRTKGHLQPQHASVEQWTSFLEKTKARENELHESLKETESVRTGPSVVASDKFRQIQEKLDHAEDISKALRKKQVSTRIQIAMVYRKQQDQRWSLLKNKLEPVEMTFSNAAVQEDEMSRLRKAKALMVQELQNLQKSFQFKMSDVDVIFQSVQSGIRLSEQTALYEMHRSRAVECEKILRQVTDWQARMQAILV